MGKRSEKIFLKRKHTNDQDIQNLINITREMQFKTRWSLSGRMAKIKRTQKFWPRYGELETLSLLLGMQMSTTLMVNCVAPVTGTPLPTCNSSVTSPAELRVHLTHPAQANRRQQREDQTCLSGFPNLLLRLVLYELVWTQNISMSVPIEWHLLMNYILRRTFDNS